MSEHSESPSKKTVLGRRTYLKAAAASATIAGFTKSAAAEDDAFEVIEVSAGNQYVKHLSPGETWENKLIDISANRASFRIIAQVGGSGTTTIRNIGIKGTYDYRDYSNNAIVIAARDPDGTIDIENFYWADGLDAGRSPEPSDDPSGISVRPAHRGTVNIDRVNMQEIPDNAIYASPAGHHSDHPAGPSGGGAVNVANSYFKDNQTADIRLGTDGVIENCVCINNRHRAVWANQHRYDGGQTLINCDLAPQRGRALAIGNNNWRGGQQNHVEVIDTRFEPSGLDLYNSGNALHGSSAGSPRDRMPEGCPTSAEEAASGSGEPPSDPFPGDFTLRMSSGDSVAEYLLELDAAAVEPGENADTHDHEYQDRAFEYDGHWYVHGYVGSGGSDDFHVEDGEVLRIGELDGSTNFSAGITTLAPSDFETIDSVPDPDGDDDDEDDDGEDDESVHPTGDFTLELTTDDAVAEYLLELDAAAVEPGENADTHDHEYQDRTLERNDRWYVHGYVGNGGFDDFQVEDGEVLRIGELDGTAQITADGELLDVDGFDDIDSIPDDEPDLPAGNFTLELTTDDAVAEYLFELDAAAVEPGENADTHDHEYQDRAFEHGGHWYVHGYVGNGGVDDFHVEDGTVLRAGQLNGSTRVVADGESVDLTSIDSIESIPDDGDEVRRLEVAGRFEYRVEVDGEIEPAADHARWLTEGDAYGDDWAEWWLSGGDNARTVWYFTGKITALDVSDHGGETEINTLEVDGTSIDPNDYA